MQSVKSDIEWMKLEQGKDYSSTVELGDLFKTYNPRYGGNHSRFSLAHEANVLPGPDLGGGGGGGATGAAAQGPLLLRGPPHGAHNNDILFFLVYSNSF